MLRKTAAEYALLKNNIGLTSRVYKIEILEDSAAGNSSIWEKTLGWLRDLRGSLKIITGVHMAAVLS